MEWITTTILLDRLHDFDDAVWNQFIDRFRGPLIDFARRMGLTDDAAQDVAQNALLAFTTAFRAGRYDRTRGRLRSWLFGIAVREVRRHRREDARRTLGTTNVAGSMDDLVGPDDERDAGALWDIAWMGHSLRASLDQLRGETAPTTFAAFEHFALRGVPAAQVARDLGITRNAVFLAKQRVLRRLEELCRDLEGER